MEEIPKAVGNISVRTCLSGKSSILIEKYSGSDSSCLQVFSVDTLRGWQTLEGKAANILFGIHFKIHFSVF